MPCINPPERKAFLEKRRRLKMAESAHAYVRGNTLQFYDFLKSRHAPKSIPVGPPVWICGDCHFGNQGPLADLKGKVEIKIRDLDQTVIGNPAHDVLRLGLGERMIPTTFAGRQVVVRELRPQDLKFEFEGLTQTEAILTARLPAGVVGKAHGRQMKGSERRSWARTLKASFTKSLEAPLWL